VNHCPFCDVLCTSACPERANCITEISRTGIAFTGLSEIECAPARYTLLLSEPFQDALDPMSILEREGWHPSVSRSS
jgi:hypothetical protein